jgi:heme/copper-type cytochrome/quinol oxidase subunit 2
LLKYILFSFKNITAIMMTIEFSIFIGLAYLMFYSLINLREE